MSEYVTALTGAGTAVAVGLTVMARSFRGTPVSPAKHRAADRLPSVDDLIGPADPYTTVDPFADTQVFGVLQTGFGWCEACRDTVPGVVSQNGFRCDLFVEHAGVGRG